MKRFLLALLFLFSTSMFAQPVIDFETVGNNWVWNPFDLGTGGMFDIVANPNPGGLNTSDSCAMFMIAADGNPWAGAYCTDFPDMTITADNCMVKILVYKDGISPVNLKLEPPNQDHFTSNTLINQWEELTFDYSSSIGVTGATLTLIPDQKPDFPRTYASVNYIDYIRFTSPPGATVDFETVGNNWVWNPFDLGTGGMFDIVANPNPGGLNTSDSCAMFMIAADGNPWAGAYCTDFPDMTITADNCMVKILVYKDGISPVNLKLEPPNQDHFTSNTLINQWEELTFDYSSSIGVTGATLTLIPDQKPDFPRTYASVNYIDYIRFTPQIVPVELTSFTGAVVGNDVQLKWATATELNNRGFEIQRSISGSAFATIAFVEGFGTTTEQKQYSFTDRNITAGVDHAYRLKQIDFDGTFDYSDVVNVGSTIPTEFALEQNYPNPFNPTTNIIYSVPVNSNVTLDVYNLIGQKVVTLFEGEVEAGKHTSQFNASSMSSGMYLFKLTAVGEDGSQFSSSKKMTLLK